MPIFVPVKEWIADQEEEAKRKLGNMVGGVQQAGQEVVQGARDQIDEAAAAAQKAKEEFANNLIAQEMERRRQQIEETIRQAQELFKQQPPPEPPQEPEPSPTPTATPTPSTDEFQGPTRPPVVPPPQYPGTPRSEPPVSQVGPIIERGAQPTPTPTPTPTPEEPPEEIVQAKFQVPGRPQMPDLSGLGQAAQGVAQGVGQKFSDLGTALANRGEAADRLFEESGLPPVDNSLEGMMNRRTEPAPIDPNASLPERVIRSQVNQTVESGNRLADPENLKQAGSSLLGALSVGQMAPGSTADPEVREQLGKDLGNVAQAAGDVGNVVPSLANMGENVAATTVLEALRDTDLPEPMKAGLALVAGSGVPTAAGKKFIVPGAKRAAGEVGDVARRLHGNEAGVLAGSAAGVPAEPGYRYFVTGENRLDDLSRGRVLVDPQLHRDPDLARADYFKQHGDIDNPDAPEAPVFREALVRVSEADARPNEYGEPGRWMGQQHLEVYGDDGQWHPVTDFTRTPQEGGEYGVPTREMGGGPDTGGPIRQGDLPQGPAPDYPVDMTHQEFGRHRRDTLNEHVGVDPADFDDVTDTELGAMSDDEFGDRLRDSRMGRRPPPDLPGDPTPGTGRPLDENLEPPEMPGGTLGAAERAQRWLDENPGKSLEQYMEEQGFPPTEPRTPRQQSMDQQRLGYRRDAAREDGVDLSDISDEDLLAMSTDEWDNLVRERSGQPPFEPSPPAEESSQLDAATRRAELERRAIERNATAGFLEDEFDTLSDEDILGMSNDDLDRMVDARIAREEAEPLPPGPLPYDEQLGRKRASQARDAGIDFDRLGYTQEDFGTMAEENWQAFLRDFTDYDTSGMPPLNLERKASVDPFDPNPETSLNSRGILRRSRLIAEGVHPDNITINNTELGALSDDDFGALGARLRGEEPPAPEMGARRPPPEPPSSPLDDNAIARREVGRNRRQRLEDYNRDVPPEWTDEDLAGMDPEEFQDWLRGNPPPHPDGPAMPSEPNGGYPRGDGQVLHEDWMDETGEGEFAGDPRLSRRNRLAEDATARGADDDFLEWLDNEDMRELSDTDYEAALKAHREERGLPPEEPPAIDRDVQAMRDALGWEDRPPPGAEGVGPREGETWEEFLRRTRQWPRRAGGRDIPMPGPMQGGATPEEGPRRTWDGIGPREGPTPPPGPERANIIDQAGRLSDQVLGRGLGAAQGWAAADRMQDEDTPPWERYIRNAVGATAGAAATPGRFRPASTIRGLARGAPDALRRLGIDEAGEGRLPGRPGQGPEYQGPPPTRESRDFEGKRPTLTELNRGSVDGKITGLEGQQAIEAIQRVARDSTDPEARTIANMQIEIVRRMMDPHEQAIQRELERIRRTHPEQYDAAVAKLRGMPPEAAPAETGLGPGKGEGLGPGKGGTQAEEGVQPDRQPDAPLGPKPDSEVTPRQYTPEQIEAREAERARRAAAREAERQARADQREAQRRIDQANRDMEKAATAEERRMIRETLAEARKMEAEADARAKAARATWDASGTSKPTEGQTELPMDVEGELPLQEGLPEPSDAAKVFTGEFEAREAQRHDILAEQEGQRRTGAEERKTAFEESTGQRLPPGAPAGPIPMDLGPGSSGGQLPLSEGPPPTGTQVPSPATVPTPAPAGKKGDPIRWWEGMTAGRYSLGFLANPALAVADFFGGIGDVGWTKMRNRVMDMRDPDARWTSMAEQMGATRGWEQGWKNQQEILRTGKELAEMTPGAAKSEVPRSLMRRAEERGDTKNARWYRGVEFPSRARDSMDSIAHGTIFGRSIYREAALDANAAAKANRGNADLQPGQPGWMRHVQEYVNAASRDTLPKEHPAYAGREKALDLANRAIGRNDPGAIGDALGLLFDNPLFKPFYPLFKTSYNIGSRGIERSPLGYLTMLYDKAAEKVYPRGGARPITRERKVDTAMGSAIWGGAMLPLAMTGNVSAYGPKDEHTRQDLMAEGWRPYSIRLPGGAWVSYRRLGAAATPLALAGAIGEAQEYHSPDEPWQGLAVDAANNFFRYFGDQFVLRTAGDLQDMSTDLGVNFPEWLGRYVSSYSGGSAMNTIASAIDPYQREVQTDDFMETFTNQLKYNIPGLREQLPLKYDAFGDPLPNPNYGPRALAPYAVGPFEGERPEASRGRRQFTGSRSAAEDQRIRQSFTGARDAALRGVEPGPENQRILDSLQGGELDYYAARAEAKAAQRGRDLGIPDFVAP